MVTKTTHKTGVKKTPVKKSKVLKHTHKGLPQKSARMTKEETAELRAEVKKLLQQKIAGIPIDEGDVDEAVKYVKRHIGKYIDLYLCSGFNPLEMCIDNYLYTLYD